MPDSNKKIFTFWEPQDKIPAYIELCIQSWKKYLPDYEVVILNYSNLEQWINKNYYDKILFKEFDVTKQSYAIRAAVLERHGGIWLDADTIITSEKIRNLINISPNSELILLGKMTRFIIAKKHSKILKIWINKIKKNLFNYKIFFPFYYKYFPQKSLYMLSWDYFCEKLLRTPLKTKNKRKFHEIDFMEARVLPELNWDKEFHCNGFKDARPNGFNHFYIKNNFADYALKDNCGIICLHNSWISRKFRNFSKEEIYAQSNTISEIFKRVL